MKLQAGKVMIGLLTIVSSLAQADSLRPYQNQITGIQEIAGARNYTLILSCTNINPIVTYAPENFDDSQDDSIHRFLLPNTTILQDLENDLAYVRQHGTSVEIYLFGRLIFNTADDGKIVFVVLPGITDEDGQQGRVEADE